MRRTRVELVECDPELPQAREELRLDLPVDRVVDALVGRGVDAPVRLADADHFRDFPAGSGSTRVSGVCSSEWAVDGRTT